MAGWEAGGGVVSAQKRWGDLIDGAQNGGRRMAKRLHLARPGLLDMVDFILRSVNFSFSFLSLLEKIYNIFIFFISFKNNINIYKIAKTKNIKKK